MPPPADHHAPGVRLWRRPRPFVPDYKAHRIAHRAGRGGYNKKGHETQTSSRGGPRQTPTWVECLRGVGTDPDGNPLAMPYSHPKP